MTCSFIQNLKIDKQSQVTNFRSFGECLPLFFFSSPSLPFHESVFKSDTFVQFREILLSGGEIIFISKTPWWSGRLGTAVNQPFWHGSLNSTSHDALCVYLNSFLLNSPWLIGVFFSFCVSEVIPLLTLIGKVPFVPLE